MDEYILSILEQDLKACEGFQETIVKPTVKNRYDMYHADISFYKKKFPKLSKTSNLVDTSIHDCIEWALPALMRLFFGATNPVTITGVYDSDQANATIMQELIQYQLIRKNNSFVKFYSWFKDSLITGMGILKCSWEREEQFKQNRVVMSEDALMALSQTPNVEINSYEIYDEFGNYVVEYTTSHYTKNNPKLENILISEFLYPPNTKDLDNCPFVAHKKRVNMSYLRQKEKEGVYSNVDLIGDGGSPELLDELEEDLNDNYSLNSLFNNPIDKARQEVTLYECYTKIDINGDGILEDMIITICNKKILRIEENVFGRHPFFTLSPVRDPHRLFPKRSFADMIGQIQDLKTALMRQLMNNIAQTNDPKMILSEDSINIDDYIQGRAVIRKKSGTSMNDVAMPMPVNPLHPWTFQFLEYADSEKERRTGITSYNQGLGTDTLNKTATGISAILGQSAQRMELVARMFSETGMSDLFRFIISLNQKFMDRDTVIRITDKEMKITADDLTGEMDLSINAGVGISTKEQNLMNIQTLMTALLQLIQSGIPVATPSNVYNLMKRWINESGIKNTGDYITDPAVVQQRMVLETQLKMQVLSTLPMPIQQEYMQTGTLRPEVMMMLPYEIQQMLGGNTFGGNATSQGNSAQGNPSGEFGGGGVGLSGGLATGISSMDNRKA